MAIKTSYQLWNDLTLAWEEYFLKTSADLIEETDTLKIMTSAERTAISDYLASFNAANKLLKLDASAKILASMVPDISPTYLLKSNPAFTGQMTGATIKGTDGIDYRSLWLLSNNETSRIQVDDDGISLVGSNIIINPGNFLSINYKPIKYLGTPTDDYDAVTKAYVDQAIALGARPASAPVEVCSATNIAVTTSTGALTIDGFLVGGTGLSNGTTKRVLLTGQTTASENGIYIVTTNTTGYSFTKQTSDSSRGIIVFVEYGSTYNNWMYWNLDGSTWAQWSKPETVTADESTITKNASYQFGLKAGGITNTYIHASAAIAWSKFASQAVSPDLSSSAYDTWADSNYTPATSLTLEGHLARLMGAIKLLRGTAAFNTSNYESISDLYSSIGGMSHVNPGVITYLLSTANIATLSGSQTIDGVSSGTDGKLIALAGQSTASQNGIYRTAAGAWEKIYSFPVGWNNYVVSTHGSNNKNKIYEVTALNTLAIKYVYIRKNTVLLTPVL